MADIAEAIKFFQKNNKFQIVRGVSFHTGFIPDNPVAFPKIPIRVIDGQFEEFEYVETVIGDFGCYYLQTLSTNEIYALIEIKECFQKNGDIKQLKNLTPAMRVMYSFHLLEKKNKEEKEPVKIIEKSIIESGAKVISITKKRHGFEVVWELLSHTINTLLDNTLRVIEAGFCTSGGDKSQSARSVPNLLKTYVEDGSHIHKTRSTN